MKVTDIIKSKELVLSMEVFPPKTADKMESTLASIDKVADLRPDFMSVTYGAGGGKSTHTVDIARHLQDERGIPVVAHLSCISSTPEEVHAQLERIKAAGIENILALRGDIPEGFDGPYHYEHANELMREVKAFGDFCMGGACYPEGHPNAATLQEDIDLLKKKVEEGCDYLTTQMFFDNNDFYSFLGKVRQAGIDLPIIPGLMPMTNAKSIKRMMSMSSASYPTRFRRLVDRFGHDNEAMRQAGIVYLTEQILDLYANGVNAVHLFAMNNPTVMAGVRRNLEGILK